MAKREPEMKFKTNQQQILELQDVETMDLAERLSPEPYESIAPHEYQKLHALHTSVQGGRESIIRLPKKKSQYSYASQARPETSCRQENLEDKDVFHLKNSSDDDFPTTAELAGISDPASYSEPVGIGLSISGQDFHASNFEADSLASLEAGMMEFDDPVMRPAENVKVDSSFVNRVFDFDAFDDVDDDEFGERPQNLSMKDCASDEQVIGLSRTASDDPAKKPNSDDQQGEAKHHLLPCAEQTLHASSATRVPEWVNEMDPSLIDFLGDSVEYID